MAITLLRITDGTTTINFSTGDFGLRSYKPTVVQEFKDFIDDDFRVDFINATVATNRASAQAVNRLFEQARNYANNSTGAKVYLEVDFGSTGTYYRSLLSNGYIEFEDETIGVLWDRRLQFTLHVTRQPFWEGALTQIPISNASATGNTLGLTITNSYDATAENFVDIDEAAVIGDLPAPIKIELENTKSDSDAAKEIYIWHNVYSTPATFDHILEAEDAAGSTVTDSGVDTTSSDDQYATLAWTATAETTIATWTLSDAFMTAAAGGRFGILARWRGAFPYTDMWIRFKLLTVNSNILWEGALKLVQDNPELTHLDDFRLGPALVGLSSIKSLKLRMFGYRNASGTHSLPLDYLQLSPISGDGGWKYFVSVDDGIAYQEELIYDDIEQHVYRVDTSSKLIPELSDFGGPILIVPNKDQRLYFNSCDKDGEAKVNQTWKVKVWYRPRRSSL